MQFVYQVRDAAGRIRSGEVSANSIEDASRQVRQDGSFLLSLDPKNSSDAEGMPLFQRRVSRKEIIYFTSQLAVMIDAGVPLAAALEGMAKQSDNPTLRQTISAVHKSVEGGEDLSAALAKFPKQFDKTFVNLVKASEASGTLGPMLDRISIQMRAEQETWQKVRGAMIYPCAMMFMCIGCSIFLLAFVFPKLTPMFSSKSMALPTPTRVMMQLSNLIVHRYYLLIGGGIAAVGAGLWFRKQDYGRRSLDWTWIRLPVIGPMLRKVALSRSLRTLATTINAGVPMLESLELSAGVASNVYYEAAWKSIGEQVTSGRPIHEALDGNPLFPPSLAQMISSGETTGKLGLVLNKVSDYFDRDVANAIKAATSLIEPIMVFAMGGIIGSIALAMLLPIFKLSGHG